MVIMDKLSKKQYLEFKILQSQENAGSTQGVLTGSNKELMELQQGLSALNQECDDSLRR
jgi:hypothetical protein